MSPDPKKVGAVADATRTMTAAAVIPSGGEALSVTVSEAIRAFEWQDWGERLAVSEALLPAITGSAWILSSDQRDVDSNADRPTISAALHEALDA